MKKQKIYAQEKNAAYKAALQEKAFSESDLLKELSPVLGDYFVADISADEQAIYFNFPNGQTFALMAQIIP